MDDGLQQLRTHVGDAPGQEEVVENQQFRLDPVLELQCQFWGAGQPVVPRVNQDEKNCGDQLCAPQTY